MLVCSYYVSVIVCVCVCIHVYNNKYVIKLKMIIYIRVVSAILLGKKYKNVLISYNYKTS